MYIVYPPNSHNHSPPFEIWNGEQTPHCEIPARLDTILKAVRVAGHQLVPTTHQLDRAILEHVHSPAYINFLSTQSQALMGKSYQYPSVFGYRGGQVGTSELGMLGYYSFDLYTPISQTTYACALESAATAAEVATKVRDNITSVGYALCRPPGHHAQTDQMGGYCYINNSAVAAQILSERGRVAILDIDFHHGNGTQQIFYESNHVFFGSIHAHPDWKFPYFSGLETEEGSGRGRGYNVNIPLREGVTDDMYQRRLIEMVEQITVFQPESLVISLGLDTHKDDPIGGFALTTSYFTKMAATIGGLDLPTVIVQEGGYNTELLGENVVSFLAGFATRK